MYLMTISLALAHLSYNSISCNMPTSTGPQLSKISFSSQEMPPIYSAVSFSSLLSMLILPKKNWVGWSRGHDWANPSLCTPQCLKISPPIRTTGSLHGTLRYPEGASFAQHFLRNSHSALGWVWSPEHHTIFLWTLTQTAFIWHSLSHSSGGLRTYWASSVSNRLFPYIGTTLSPKHARKVLSSSQKPSCWQQFIKLIQSGLNPSSE